MGWKLQTIREFLTTKGDIAVHNLFRHHPTTASPGANFVSGSAWRLYGAD